MPARSLNQRPPLGIFGIIRTAQIGGHAEHLATQPPFSFWYQKGISFLSLSTDLSPKSLGRREIGKKSESLRRQPLNLERVRPNFATKPVQKKFCLVSKSSFVNRNLTRYAKPQLSYIVSFLKFGNVGKCIYGLSELYSMYPYVRIKILNLISHIARWSIS